MKVRLRRVLARYLDGIDLRGHQAGDVVDLPASEAQLLIAERWAILERRTSERPSPSHERRSRTKDPLPDTSNEGSSRDRNR